METWIATWPPGKAITEDDFDKFQDELRQHLNETEPFCQGMDECALADFTLPQCQPKRCPFVDQTACRYLTACLTETLQQEYADALELSKDTTPPPSSSKKAKGKTATGFSWGL